MTSFPNGPVHNAVRRMTELIDLENVEGYFDEYIIESQNQSNNNQDKDFHAITEETVKEAHSPM